jgi:hypothetical protein
MESLDGGHTKTHSGLPGGWNSPTSIQVKICSFGIWNGEDAQSQDGLEKPIG